MKPKLFKILILLTLFIVSCNKNNVYFEYHTVDPIVGWEKDSAYTFTVNVEDTLSAYNIYIHVRNTPDYPRQNMWLFLAETQDSIQTKDTIEFYLANHQGKWLGSGVGSIKEMPVLYKTDYHFSDSICVFEIKHGMRIDSLKGVNDIGIRVEKVQ